MKFSIKDLFSKCDQIRSFLDRASTLWLLGIPQISSLSRNIKQRKQKISLVVKLSWLVFVNEDTF